MIPRRKIYVIRGEFSLALQTVLKTKQFSHYIVKWEEEFARFMGTKHAITVASGRKGMELILRSLRLDRGDEVIMPAYTLKDLIEIIQAIGLTPVVADIDPETFNINPISIAEKLTKRTRAILATHLFGTPCQIDKIKEIAKNKSIFVIEDCAHSLGSEFNGRKTGSFGHASFFSLETIKPVNTYGGGMVVTDDEELAKNVREANKLNGTPSKVPLKKIIAAFLENYFLPSPMSFPMLYLFASKHWGEKMYNLYRRLQRFSSTNSFFTDFQAFLALEKLKTLKERIAKKQTKAVLLKSLLDRKIIPQKVLDTMSPNYYFFVALIPENIHRVRKLLLRHGIDAGIGAEIADDCANYLGQADCPNTTQVFQHAIHIPLHEEMSLNHIRYIARELGRLAK